MTREYNKLAMWTLFAALLASSPASAEDTIKHEIKLKKLGVLQMELPAAWGRKPKITKGNGPVNASFGPFGPRREPTFLVSMDLAVVPEDVEREKIEYVAKSILENYRPVALEAEIPIVLVEGDTSYGYYFTLTDKEQKPREYQYLTLAVVYTNRMVITSFFLANDGAPDFGADALHMMRTTKFIPLPEDD